MQYAGRKFDGRKAVDGSSTDESSWTEVRRKLDRSLWTKVQRTKVRRCTYDESWAEVRRTSDESPTYVERVELSRRYRDGERQCYTAAPRNATTMAGNAVARNVVAALAGNALQLATFLRRYCSNALDLAALLRWPATRCCYNNVLDLATLLRQRVGPRSDAAMVDNALDLAAFFFFFFFLKPATCRVKNY